MRDITPLLLAACDSCCEEANCHPLEELRWTIVDENSTAKPIPVCETCWDSMDDVPLEWEYLPRVVLRDPGIEKLSACCGYVENGTSETVRVGQDDATKTWNIDVGDFMRGRSYSGRSLEEALTAAYEGEREKIE